MTFELFNQGKDNPKLLIGTDCGLFLQALLVQLSSDIIRFTVMHDPEMYAKISVGSGKQIREAEYWRDSSLTLFKETRWASNMVLNGIVQKVSFVYDICKGLVAMEDGYVKFSTLNFDSVHVIIHALECFQAWKTKEIKKEKELMESPNWGDAMGWNTVDWTDQNEKIHEILIKIKDQSEQRRREQDARNQATLSTSL